MSECWLLLPFSVSFNMPRLFQAPAMTSRPVGGERWAGESLLMGLAQLADRPGGEMPQRAKLCPPGDQETREKVPLWCVG